jgi:hypothetical protein
MRREVYKIVQYSFLVGREERLLSCRGLVLNFKHSNVKAISYFAASIDAEMDLANNGDSH